MQEIINNDFDIQNLLSKIKKLESENTKLKKQNSILRYFTPISKHEIQEPINLWKKLEKKNYPKFENFDNSLLDIDLCSKN